MQCDENNILDNRLTELHWFYSPFYFMDSKVDSQKICKMRSIGREPVLVLDRNIFSRLINVVSKGKTDEGSTKDIAFHVSPSNSLHFSCEVLHNIIITYLFSLSLPQ